MTADPTSEESVRERRRARGVPDCHRPDRHTPCPGPRRTLPCQEHRVAQQDDSDPTGSRWVDTCVVCDAVMLACLQGGCDAAYTAYQPIVDREVGKAVKRIHNVSHDLVEDWARMTVEEFLLVKMRPAAQLQVQRHRLGAFLGKVLHDKLIDAVRAYVGSERPWDIQEVEGLGIPTTTPWPVPIEMTDPSKQPDVDEAAQDTQEPGLLADRMPGDKGMVFSEVKTTWLRSRVSLETGLSEQDAELVLTENRGLLEARWRIHAVMNSYLDYLGGQPDGEAKQALLHEWYWRAGATKAGPSMRSLDRDLAARFGRRPYVGWASVQLAAIRADLMSRAASYGLTELEQEWLHMLLNPPESYRNRTPRRTATQIAADQAAAVTAAELETSATDPDPDPDAEDVQ
jgi:hypothetical protein